MVWSRGCQDCKRRHGVVFHRNGLEGWTKLVCNQGYFQKWKYNYHIWVNRLHNLRLNIEMYECVVRPHNHIMQDRNCGWDKNLWALSEEELEARLRLLSLGFHTGTVWAGQHRTHTHQTRTCAGFAYTLYPFLWGFVIYLQVHVYLWFTHCNKRLHF